MHDFFAVLSPVNRNVLVSTITLVVGYLHPPSQVEGSNGGNTSVQSNGRDSESFGSPWFQLHRFVQYTEMITWLGLNRVLNSLYSRPEERISRKWFPLENCDGRQHI